MRKIIQAVIAVALVVTPTIALSNEAAPKVLVTDADPALWIMRDEDTTIYLFGTVHILKPGLTWFDEGVKSAFDSSQELITEMKFDEKAQMQSKIMTWGITPGAPPLSAVLSQKDYAAYQSAAQKHGIKGAALDPFEPWMIALVLATIPLIKDGYDLNSGVETVLEAAAAKAKMNQSALETADEQLGFFDSLPQETQVQFLNATVAEMDKIVPSIAAMIDAWGTGRTEELATLMNSSASMSPKLYKALLTDRNARWAEKLDARMDKPGTVFVAVGAGHLAGKDSVQELLTARGFKVERVAY